MQKQVVSPVPALLKWSALAALALTICMSHTTCDVHTDLGARSSELAPGYDVQGTGRRPLVVVGGVTEQLPTADYISTVGGLTTNGAAPAAGDLQSTTATVGTATVTTDNVTTGNITTANITTGTVSGQFALSGTITPTAFTGTGVNNYNPSGLSGAYVINQGITSATTITGLTAQPTGTTLIFRNVGTATITFSNLSASSTSANQFNIGASWNLLAGSAFVLRYSGSDWRIVGWAPGSTGDIPNLTVDGLAQLGQVKVTSQTFSTTGTSNDIVLNSTTTVFSYSGTADATFTGFQSGSVGRILIIQNISTHNISLPDLSGSSAASNQLNNPGAATISLIGAQSSAVYVYNLSLWRLVAYTSTANAVPTSFTSTTNKGTITLSGGTGTATTFSGAVCLCSDTTTLGNACKPSVSSTTLTVTGTGTDVIAYHCL